MMPRRVPGVDHKIPFICKAPIALFASSAPFAAFAPTCEVRGARCEIGCWMSNSPRCRPGPSRTAACVGGGRSNASLCPDFGL